LSKPKWLAKLKEFLWSESELGQKKTFEVLKTSKVFIAKVLETLAIFYALWQIIQTISIGAITSDHAVEADAFGP
jgi:hypothetical protein